MPRSANPVPQYFTAENKILVGGKVYYFNAGTSTPKTTYSDEDETIPNSHPVILDAAGRLPDVFFTGTAKQILKDSDDIQIWERDNVGSVEQISDFNAYSLNISYDAGDIVKFAGGFYLSLQNSNQNNQPNSAFAFWAEVRFIEVYNSTVDYPLGRIIQTSDGNMWKCVNSPNQGNSPSTDSGANWKPSLDESKFKDLVSETITTSGLASVDSLNVTNNTATGSLNVANNTTTGSLNVTSNTVMNGVNAQDVDTSSLKRSGSNVYTRTDIVGSVGESGGVPTGAIIESGNGFIKYADGTLICDVRAYSIPSGGAIWIYPIPFVSTPTVTHSIVRVVATATPLMSLAHAPSTSQIIFLILDVSGVFLGTETIDATAIGRWF